MQTAYTVSVCSASPQNTGLAVPRRLGVSHCMPMGYGDNIAILRRRKGLTQEQLADLLKVEQPTVQRWETGTREPNMSKLVQIALALGVEPGDLFNAGFTPLGPRLYVKGEVAAGVWREAFELPMEEWQTFMGRADVTAELEHRFGLRVSGESMNEVYPHGTIVECVSVFGRAEIEPGKRVVVLRKRLDDGIEATVKELRQDGDGRLWAVPRSYNPSFRPIALDEPEEGIEETRIIAIVVASYRPE